MPLALVSGAGGFCGLLSVLGLLWIGGWYARYGRDGVVVE